MNRLDLLTAGAGAILAGVMLLEDWPKPPVAVARAEPPAHAATLARIEVAQARPPACAPLDVELPALPSIPGEPPVPAIERAWALDPFFAKLARLLRGNATDHVRVLVYGDSNASRDYMTGAMRRIVQTKYGDAGHGYLGLGRPWSWYDHMDVRFDRKADAWITWNVTSKPLWPEGYYGHGMIQIWSLPGGSKTWVETSDPLSSTIGTTASRFDVHYLRGPRLGSFAILVDGQKLREVETDAPEYVAGFAEVRVPDGPHKLVLAATPGHRFVRIMGVSIERETPGIVIDNVGIGMLSSLMMLRDEPSTNRDTLAHRRYDLVIFHVGTLESPWRYQENMRKIIARHRDALPGVPILIMSSPDFLDNQYPVHSAPWVVKVRDEQRKFAKESGLAFFDFHGAMGGVGSFGWFEREKMSIQDGVHFNEKGGAFMGERTIFALWRDMKEYAAEHPTAGCEAR